MTLEASRLPELQAQILDQVHDSVITMDLTGRIVNWNQGAARLHGYSANEAIGEHISFVAEPKYPTVFDDERLGHLIATGFLEFDGSARTKSGCVHPVHVRLSLIRDASNIPVGVLAISADTSDLQKARTDLQYRERQLRAILDAIPLPIAQVDTQLQLRFANRAHRQLVHPPSGELVGTHIKDTLGDNFEAQLPYISRVLSGHTAVTELEMMVPEGESRSLVVHRVPDINGDGAVTGYFAVATDVTETKRIHAKRLEEERQLRETLISEVHHRVKNCLQGTVGLLRAHATKNPHLADALAPAISQVLSISVGFGLTSTRGGRGIVLCDMVREIGKNIEQITAKSISTKFDQSIVDRPIVLERSQAVTLGMVVNELIFNAAKHGSPLDAGPQVTVLVSRSDEGSNVCISNQVISAPLQFDFQSGAGLGTGLTLVRALLPSDRSKLMFTSDGNQVMATLTLYCAESAPATAEG